MLNFFKKKREGGREAFEEACRVIESRRFLNADLFVSHPVDAKERIIALDDLVIYRGAVFQVVAMSHKQKVVLRKPGATRGGFWVASHNCTIVKRHARKEN